MPTAWPIIEQDVDTLADDRASWSADIQRPAINRLLASFETSDLIGIWYGGTSSSFLGNI